MNRTRLVVAALAVVAAMALAAAAIGTATPESPPPQGSEEDFVPSERLPADSAISFPVDI